MIGIARPTMDNQAYLPVRLISLVQRSVRSQFGNMARISSTHCPAMKDPIAKPTLFGNRWAPAVAELVPKMTVKNTGLQE